MDILNNIWKSGYLSFAIGLSAFVFMSALRSSDLDSKLKTLNENHAPLVKISEPKNNEIFKFDMPVKYSISVSDQEDGESKLQEIESNEVLLEVKYLADSTKILDKINARKSGNEAGLTAMRISNCLNCHAFNSKLIGPSFFEISKRYPDTNENRSKLEKSIIDGLSGTWGAAIMPTHAELTKEEVSQMVAWILRKGADSTVSYYRGTEGSFLVKPPFSPNKKSVLMITASYVDHGLKDLPKTNLMGQDIIILHSNEIFQN